MKKLVVWKNKTAKKEYLKALISDKNQEAFAYDKDDNLNVGDYINHFKFGFGFIQKVINPSKVEVFFEDTERTMLQNWQKN